MIVISKRFWLVVRNYELNDMEQKKEGNVRFTTLSNQEWNRYQISDIRYQIPDIRYDFENWLFSTVVSLKSDLRIYTTIKHTEIIRFLQFCTKETDNIFHIINHIKVSRVPLWIGHCHICMEGILTLSSSFKSEKGQCLREISKHWF